MCIIVAIPEHKPLPNIETMRECFKRNPDGAGFMYADGKSVKIRKGFMKFDDFLDALEGEDIPEDTAIILHFRIATSGKVKQSTCHPFPVSDVKEELQATRTECRFGLAHNGVISGRTTYDGWSDTMDFTAKVVTPLARMNPSFMHSTEAKELLKGACQSKLAILDNSGQMMLVGDFIEDDGIFYSNSTYLALKTDWSSYGDWWKKYTPPTQAEGDLDDDEWDEWSDLDTLPYDVCQECPLNVDCAKYGKLYDYECASEKEAIEVCADFLGVSVMDMADWVGYDKNDL